MESNNNMRPTRSSTSPKSTRRDERDIGRLRSSPDSKLSSRSSNSKGRKAKDENSDDMKHSPKSGTFNGKSDENTLNGGGSSQVNSSRKDINLLTEIHLEHANQYDDFIKELATTREPTDSFYKYVKRVIKKRKGLSCMDRIKENAALISITMEKLSETLSIMKDICQRAETIPPIYRRKFRIKAPINVTLLADYKHEDIHLKEGDEVQLIDNSSTEQWKIHILHTKLSFYIPSIYLFIPPPDLDALEKTNRLQINLSSTWSELLLSIRREVVLCLKVFLEEIFSNYSKVEVSNLGQVKKFLRRVESCLLKDAHDPEDLALRVLLQQLKGKTSTGAESRESYFLSGEQLSALQTIVQGLIKLLNDWVFLAKELKPSDIGTTITTETDASLPLDESSKSLKESAPANMKHSRNDRYSASASPKRMIYSAERVETHEDNSIDDTKEISKSSIALQSSPMESSRLWSDRRPGETYRLENSHRYCTKCCTGERCIEENCLSCRCSRPMSYCCSCDCDLYPSSRSPSIQMDCSICMKQLETRLSPIPPPVRKSIDELEPMKSEERYFKPIRIISDMRDESMASPEEDSAKAKENLMKRLNEKGNMKVVGSTKPATFTQTVNSSANKDSQTSGPTKSSIALQSNYGQPNDQKSSAIQTAVIKKWDFSGQIGFGLYKCNDCDTQTVAEDCEEKYFDEALEKLPKKNAVKDYSDKWTDAEKSACESIGVATVNIDQACRSTQTERQNSVLEKSCGINPGRHDVTTCCETPKLVHGSTITDKINQRDKLFQTDFKGNTVGQQTEKVRYLETTLAIIPHVKNNATSTDSIKSRDSENQSEIRGQTISNQTEGPHLITTEVSSHATFIDFGTNTTETECEEIEEDIMDDQDKQPLQKSVPQEEDIEEEFITDQKVLSVQAGLPKLPSDVGIQVSPMNIVHESRGVSVCASNRDASSQNDIIDEPKKEIILKQDQGFQFSADEFDFTFDKPAQIEYENKSCQHLPEYIHVGIQNNDIIKAEMKLATTSTTEVKQLDQQNQHDTLSNKPLTQDHGSQHDRSGTEDAAMEYLGKIEKCETGAQIDLPLKRNESSFEFGPELRGISISAEVKMIDVGVQTDEEQWINSSFDTNELLRTIGELIHSETWVIDNRTMKPQMTLNDIGIQNEKIIHMDASIQTELQKRELKNQESQHSKHSHEAFTQAKEMKESKSFRDASVQDLKGSENFSQQASDIKSTKTTDTQCSYSMNNSMSQTDAEAKPEIKQKTMKDLSTNFLLSSNNFSQQASDIKSTKTTDTQCSYSMNNSTSQTDAEAKPEIKQKVMQTTDTQTEAEKAKPEIKQKTMKDLSTNFLLSSKDFTDQYISSTNDASHQNNHFEEVKIPVKTTVSLKDTGVQFQCLLKDANVEMFELPNIPSKKTKSLFDSEVMMDSTLNKTIQFEDRNVKKEFNDIGLQYTAAPQEDAKPGKKVEFNLNRFDKPQKQVQFNEEKLNEKMNISAKSLVDLGTQYIESKMDKPTQTELGREDIEPIVEKVTNNSTQTLYDEKPVNSDPSPISKNSKFTSLIPYQSNLQSQETQTEGSQKYQDCGVKYLPDEVGQDGTTSVFSSIDSGLGSLKYHTMQSASDDLVIGASPPPSRSWPRGVKLNSEDTYTRNKPREPVELMRTESSNAADTKRKSRIPIEDFEDIFSKRK